MHWPLLHVNSFSDGHAGIKRNVVADVLRDRGANEASVVCDFPFF